MRIVRRFKEAYALIESNIEQTMFFRIETEKTMVLVASLEERENIEDYPEGMVLNMYGNGAGWSIGVYDFINNSGYTLMDRLSTEHGLHSGDITLHANACLKNHTNINYTYIEGTDLELLDILPHLAEGNYCFIIRNRNEKGALV